MTERQVPYGVTAECLSCGGSYVPRMAGHVFCSVFCRHRGERKPDQRVPVDREAIERLFAPDRDVNERCRADDWYPESCVEMKHLDTGQTVAARRRWYSNLLLRH